MKYSSAQHLKAKPLNIALLATTKGYGFVNQAVALAAALTELGLASELTLISENETYRPASLADLIIPVGAWQDYGSIIEPALATGKPTLPWIIADDRVINFPGSIRNKLNGLSLLLTTSENCKQNFIRNGVAAPHIEVLYECVDETVWRPYSAAQLHDFLEYISISTPTGAQLPAHFDMVAARRSDVPILFTTGGSTTPKGGREIIQALGQLDKSKPWLYLIKTWPSQGTFYDGAVELELAEKYGIRNRIRYICGEFSGTFLLGLMNTCDIYVAASHREGFGLPIVEAQMCGKMVVTHGLTATAETVTDRITGLVAEAHLGADNEAYADIDDLTAKLDEAISNTAMRTQLARQARSLSIKRFGMRTIAAQLIRIAEQFIHACE